MSCRRNRTLDFRLGFRRNIVVEGVSIIYSMLFTTTTELSQKYSIYGLCCEYRLNLTDM